MMRKPGFHIALASFALYGVTLIGIIWLLFFLNRPAPAPLAWGEVSLLPHHPVCPGERFAYSVSMVVHESGAVYTFSAIRRADDHPVVQEIFRQPETQAMLSATGYRLIGDTVISGRGSDVFLSAFTDDELPGVLIDPDPVFVVPDLPPGPYVRLVAAGLWGRNSTPIIRAERFEIGADCE